MKSRTYEGATDLIIYHIGNINTKGRISKIQETIFTLVFCLKKKIEVKVNSPIYKNNFRVPLIRTQLKEVDQKRK